MVSRRTVPRKFRLDCRPVPNRKWAGLVLAAIIGTLALGIGPTSGQETTPTVSQPPDDEGLLLFESRIRPLLVAQCLECHSTETEANGQLLLDSRPGWERGGASGPAIVPGRPDESRLIEAVEYGNPHLQMPPDEQLSPRERADLRRWIELGAPDPRVSETSTKNNNEQGLSVDRAFEHWAYRPISRPRLPNRPDRQGDLWTERTPIDRFIDAEIAARNATPAPAAEPNVLIRRLYHDLHGLAPTPAQLAAFEHNHNPDAYEQLVDELLASPRFSERIARHWLDVARYAESLTLRGFILPNAWRYRDYCIAAFGADRSWQDMIREQLAGDQLPAADLDDQQHHMVAVTFLLLGNTNLEEQDKPQLEMDLIDEQLETTGRAFLAQTLGCARCHDHKFDPIPTADYYALAGILKSSVVLEHENVSKWIERPLPLPADEQRRWDDLQHQHETLQHEIASVQQALQAAEKQSTTAPAPNAAAELKQRLSQLQQDEKRLAAELAQRPKAMALLPAAEPKDLAVHIRGSVHQLGRVVPRGFLTAVNWKNPTVPSQPQPLAPGAVTFPNDSPIPDRRALANWIADHRNPLTARVIANRIWAWTMGQGLVRTVDNFGTTGEVPSHPELLDWLATELIDHDWSTKYLVRQIVLSSAYRRSSQLSEPADNLDPENRSLRLAHRKPVDAEALRDIMLQLSGELDTRMSGSRIPNELTSDYGYVANDFCRSVYLPMFRNSIPELLDTFNLADPSVSTGQRNRTIGPQQALLMINHPWVAARAARIAERLSLRESAGSEAWIDNAYRTILARFPTSAERATITAYLENQRQAGIDERLASSRVVHALLASVDFRFLE